MGNISGTVKPDLQALPQVTDRMTFLYLEHCQIGRDNGAITAKDEEGIVYIPAASLSVLMLGPGTSVTHRAMELIGDAGVTMIWVGEKGVRYYASGRPLTNKSSLLQKQAEMVSNQRSHLLVARKMYELRFPDEDVSKLTMQQLRGREGSRVKNAYREEARKWGIQWSGRDYNPNDFLAGDAVNQSLSAGNACLYGLAHAVIAALGCSPGLGFVHIGRERSFVYDIGDLYKADVTIPIAFELASKNVANIAAETRRRVRDELYKQKILGKMVRDIKWLLSDTREKTAEFEDESNLVLLWDNARGYVQSAKNYGAL